MNKLLQKQSETSFIRAVETWQLGITKQIFKNDYLKYFFIFNEYRILRKVIVWQFITLTLKTIFVAIRIIGSDFVFYSISQNIIGFHFIIRNPLKCIEINLNLKLKMYNDVIWRFMYRSEK